MADARLGISVSADAKQASATFKELAADIKKVGTESVGVTEGVAKVDAAMAKLAKAPDTPMALAKAVAKAKLEVDELRAALEKTPASADKLKSINAALAQAESAMQGAIVRAGKLKDSQEAVAQQMGLSAKGAEALAGKLGSTSGAMGVLADSSSVLGQSVAKAGFVMFALSEAWKLATGLGKALAEQVDKQAAKHEAAAAKAEANAAAHQKVQIALNAAQRGNIALGRSMDEMVRNYDAYAERQRAARTATEDTSRALDEQKMLLDQLAEIAARVRPATSFKILSPEEADAQLDAVRALAQGLSDVLGKALAEGGAAERDAWANANKEAIEKVIADFTKFGLEVPPIVQAAYEAMKAGAQGLAEPTVEELKKIVDAAVRMREAAEAQGKQARENTTATEAAERAQRQWTEATHDGITEMNGWVGVAGPAQTVMLQYAAATKEAKEELLGFLEAQRARRAAVLTPLLGQA